MNEDEEKPILKDSDTKKHNKTVVIETRQEIKKVHSHKHSDSSKKKFEEKHHHHHESNDNEEIHHQRQQENVQLHSEVKEKRNNSNHVHFHHQKNEMNYSKEKEELRKWRAFGDHIIDMLLLSIPKSEIPSIPQVGKMAAIETLCSTACRILQNPSQNPKYQELEAKYNKCKNQMRSMRKKCSQLHIEVQRNQQMLYHHMQSIHQKEEDAVEKKLHKLEAILSEQCKIQQIQFANLDDFDYSHSQTSQYYRTKNSPPRIKTNNVIKTKKVIKVTNNKTNSFISDMKGEEESSSEPSSNENENQSENYIENGNVDNHKTNNSNKNSDILIIREEEEEEELNTSNSANYSKQSIQISKNSTHENSS
ncbi:hypothetical protein M9Y10_043241 [Tritrichomonas musculus]|uniref:Cilium assembly protein DZIP1 N-terminal domain-containing protein n=1 Tax=Tritrichomonas musculus TaxID=1915356 RepID=A0ABR2K219_9EUKA